VPQPKNGYTYCVSSIGHWAVSRWDDGQETRVSEFTLARAIRLIGANQIGVRTAGGSIAVIANDVTLGEFTDDTYTSGAVQLMCGTPFGQPPFATCHFDAPTIEPLSQ